MNRYNRYRVLSKRCLESPFVLGCGPRVRMLLFLLLSNLRSGIIFIIIIIIIIIILFFFASLAREGKNNAWYIC